MRVHLVVVLALFAAGSAGAQVRTAQAGRAAAPDTASANRVQRALRTDLAESFPGARIQVTLQEGRARIYVDVEAPRLGKAAAEDVLDTIGELASTNLRIHAPGYVMSGDSTYTVRSDGRVFRRRAADPGGRVTEERPARQPVGRPVRQAVEDELAVDTEPEEPPAVAPRVPRKRVVKTVKGKKVVDVTAEEEEALRREKEEIARLKRGPAEKPWEEMQVVQPPPPAPREEVPDTVLADLIDLPTARTAPKHKVVAHLTTSFRDLGNSVFSNVADASERIQELDFRVGLTSRLEAQVRPYFSDLDVTPVTPGSFSAGSSDQGAASFGLRYRLPFHEGLFQMAFGANAAIIKDADREFLLPDDFERLRGLYAVFSRPGGNEPSWHVSLGWTPLDVPAGFPDSSLWKLGAGLDHDFSQRIRGLFELVYKSLDGSTVGRFGRAADTDHLAVNLGVRSAFRFATVDLFARRLATDDWTEFGLALHSEL